jgi:uncharacterized OB-fold protein
MQNCGNCGRAIEDGVRLCPSCGKETGAAVSAAGADDGKTMSVIAYLLFFVPLLTGAHRATK